MSAGRRSPAARRRRLVVALLVALAALLSQLGVAGPAAATPGPQNAPEYWFDSWHIQQLWAPGPARPGHHHRRDRHRRERAAARARRPDPGRHRLRRRAATAASTATCNGFGHGTAMASIMVARPGLLGHHRHRPGRAASCPIAVPLRGHDRRGQARPPGRGDPLRRRPRRQDHQHVARRHCATRPSDTAPCPDAEQQAVYYALAKGAVVVASVGNTGPTRNAVEDPAACLGVVSVGATDASGGVASFSAREPYLTLVAPGVSVPSLGRIAGDGVLRRRHQPGHGDRVRGAGRRVVGRSRSVPARPDRGPAARHPGHAPQHTELDGYGYGLLDLYRLVTTAVPAGAPNPVYTPAEPFRRRDDALRFVSPTHPRPAATAPARDDGTLRRRGPPAGVAATSSAAACWPAVGLLGLLVLAPVGLRRSRARRPRADGRPDPAWAPAPVPAGPPAASVAPVAPTEPDAPPARPVPRPRPRPGPPG